MWRGRSAPEAGDIVIYDWDGGDPDHIGIVEEYLGAGTFSAIEGNTNNAVRRRTRYMTQVSGFGRVT